MEGPALIMAKIISFEAKKKQKALLTDPAYERVIHAMEKVDLLEEMVRFQEKRSQVGALSTEMMVRGRILFSALELAAETRELALLTRSYRKHLEHELETARAQSE